jgi:hypothetical protein
MSAQAITILYGANVQCSASCMITLRSIHLENVLSAMHVGGHVTPKQNGGVLDNKVM